MMLPAPAEWPHIDEFCAPSTYRAVSNLEKGKVCHMPTYRAFLHELMASFVPSDNDMVNMIHRLGVHQMLHPNNVQGLLA
jgi:hypothetical protein